MSDKPWPKPGDQCYYGPRDDDGNLTVVHYGTCPEVGTTTTIPNSGGKK